MDHRPNVLFVTTDQQHSRMMSCAGEPDVSTPNLDKLAASGTRFDLAYSPNPVCVPCRYSWLTGVMPHKFEGMEDNFKGRRNDMPVIRECIDTPSLGWLFRDAGYETVLGGKMHVEGPYNYQKEDEEKFGFTHLISNNREELVTACADFLKRPHETPVFLWASFDNPHDICSFRRQMDEFIQRTPAESLPPLPANFEPTRDETEWMEGFRKGTLGEEDEFELGLNRSYGQAAQEWDELTWRYYRAFYRHYVEVADAQIGGVLDALRESGLEDNTVVIFTSDHGDHDGAHQLAMKRSFYEESAHVPFIISGQGARPVVVDSQHLINTGLDLIPTLCDYARIEVPSSLKGRSLRPIANGESCSNWPEFAVSQTVGGRMIRTKRYKYNLYSHTKSEEQLFDVQNDPGETQNLASDPNYAEELAKHRSILSKWVEEEHDDKAKDYIDKLS